MTIVMDPDLSCPFRIVQNTITESKKEMFGAATLHYNGNCPQRTNKKAEVFGTKIRLNNKKNIIMTRLHCSYYFHTFFFSYHPKVYGLKKSCLICMEQAVAAAISKNFHPRNSVASVKRKDQCCAELGLVPALLTQQLMYTYIRDDRYLTRLVEVSFLFSIPIWA